MEHFKLLPWLLLLWPFFMPSTHQLQNSQTQVLLQLRKHLEFPSALQAWENYSGDLCEISATAHMGISCQGNSVTELKIMGDKLFKPFDMFHGAAIPNHTLSETFSIDSLVTTLTRLTSLRVLSLVYLGIYGELPQKIHRLYFLEFLDLSSNYLFGSVPPEISKLVKLQTLVLDGNYFSGSVPDSFDSLTNLTVLGLKNNRFKGPFPSSICRIGTLTNLALSRNEISGELPDLSNLENLHILDLRENRLDSELPLMPKLSVTVLLSKNSFSGEIPGHFGDLDQLQHLDLSFNHLTGTPPPFLFSLPNISYLDLASNKLSGRLPMNLNCGGKLGFVDLSNNGLIGSLPTCLSSTSGERVVKLGGNCLSIKGDQDQHQEFLCRKAETENKQLGGRKIGTLVAVLSGAILILVFFATGVLVLCRKRCCSCTRETPVQQTRPKAALDNPRTGLSPEVLASARLISQTTQLGAQGAPACRSFSFEELKEATNNFNSSGFLGEGSIGKLYRGTLENGTSVAIRCLVLSKKYSTQSIRARLDWLSKLNHPHLVTLLGHCIETSEEHYHASFKLFLVYEYMSNGSYHKHLSESNPEKILTWPDRLGILIEVAKAVHFLHTGVMPGSFTNHLRTNNILLDQHRIAKLSDYGVSVIIEENQKLEAKTETQKPKKKGKTEDDVYNFGFILMESLIGDAGSGKGEAFLLNEMSFGSQRMVVDPTVLTTSSEEALGRVISITNKCLLTDPSSRPSFEDVLWNLHYAAQLQAHLDPSS
ncbi:PREDICTED: probable inactive leucine-rich repeat receptor-like protein kinase At3g03770 isoform X2 [Tarenaya hassleriana]|uniref:probable inactive leucine-rich repeat receptor-like protein kinase At3g03770 isoform X2 n=1 Tax=Tarenaya hassleriana TaxID=28532 RepID=UPI00053C7165|nr:PREDICTED: probable inactive leucine-rich repeat receptor-like protein kinase At3g03770 isoform X2 [Tarenaya hassleriana]